MRLRYLALLALLPLTALGDVVAIPAATREGLIGAWEAIVQDDSAAIGVYQMVIPKEGDAHLIQLYAARAGRPLSNFFGSASSINLDRGNLTIRFVMAPQHRHKDDWIEIRAYAAVLEPDGMITGKIIRHHGGDPQWETTESVAFKKGRWLLDVQRLSDEASRILKSPKFEDGQAISNTP